MKYETYNLRLNGKHIRKATRVILEDGRTFQFMERMSNREAKRQVERILKKKDALIYKTHLAMNNHAQRLRDRGWNIH